MSLTNTLILIISLLSLWVSYLVFKSNQRPYIIVYAETNIDKPSVINLVIENIGNSYAKNVIFQSEDFIPMKAWGLDGLSAPKEEFDIGIFKHGIQIFHPQQKFTYEWGQFGGLKEALKGKALHIRATYSYRFPLSFFQSKLTDNSVINIAELEGLPIGVGGNRAELQKIIKELNGLTKEIKKTSKTNGLKKVDDNFYTKPPQSLESQMVSEDSDSWFKKVCSNLLNLK